MEKKEKVFAEGLIFKAPHPNAPDFVKGSLSVKVEEFKTFLDKCNNNGWVNISLKESKQGKFYAELDTWKPKDVAEQAVEKYGGEVIDENSVPF